MKYVLAFIIIGIIATIFSVGNITGYATQGNVNTVIGVIPNPSICGNGIFEAGEICENIPPGHLTYVFHPAETCESLGYGPGILGCINCVIIDTTNCAAPPQPEPRSGIREPVGTGSSRDLQINIEKRDDLAKGDETVLQIFIEYGGEFIKTPVSEAIVTIIDPQGNEFIEQTGMDGSLIIYLYEDGIYKIFAEKKGYDGKLFEYHIRKVKDRIEQKIIKKPVLESPKEIESKTVKIKLDNNKYTLPYGNIKVSFDVLYITMVIIALVVVGLIGYKHFRK